MLGKLRNKSEQKQENKNEETDIFDVVASAIRCGIRYEDLGHMTFVELSNILDAFMPKKHKPTQAEIDLIT